MNHNLVLNASIELKAAAPRVWLTLTDPAQIKLWLFGTDTITDWKPGSAVIFQGEHNGMSYKDKGIVVENRDEKLLSYKYWSGFSGLEDIPENYSLVSFSIETKEDHILLSVTQKGFANEAALNHSKANWQYVLNILKDIAEKNP